MVVTKDYVSPGLHVVVPDAHFPGMRAANHGAHPWKYLRREVPHLWYADHRFPLMGFLNRDEAAIVYNLARQFAGRPALEIGSWLGWSTCHLALAGVELDVIDPAHARPEVRAIAEASIASCGVSARVSWHPLASPDAIHTVAAARGGGWNLFVIDGDHEAPGPELDVHACLPYAAADCAFVLHDLASPAVGAALRILERAGFTVRVYQTAQIIGIAWRGDVTPVAHIPDPDVAWQLPHHLVGLTVSGVTFDRSCATTTDAQSAAAVRARQETAQESRPVVKQLRDVESGAAGGARPSVCIVSAEVVGPFKNGGIGTAMTGLAEHLAGIGCRVTMLYTRSVWADNGDLDAWKKRYAEIGIRLVSFAMADLPSLAGPLSDQGFSAPYLTYQYLAAHPFDVVHFNDCGGDGSLCLITKRLGRGFHDTLLVVALHSPSQWVLELNHTLPSNVVLSAYRYAEQLSVKCADVLWSPSRYLTDWAKQHAFELPEQTFIQPYVLPSPRLKEDGRRSATTDPDIRYGRTAPPTEIVFFGRLEERKGLRLFCDAIHHLNPSLATRNIRVSFLGKEETCAGMDSLSYIAMRSAQWRFPVQTLTHLGQPEALAYLSSGEKLAVMASPVDNSPCTVYEALAWGFPFLAARTGGVPELVADADRDHVLFEPTTDALCAAINRTLDTGGWIARPSELQADTRRVWTAFHSHATNYLPPRTGDAAGTRTDRPARRVVAVVDGRAVADLHATLQSLAGLPSVQHVVVLNRLGVGLPPHSGTFSVRNIDLLVEGAEALRAALAVFTDESVLMIHAGIRVRASAFARMCEALSRTDIGGLQPAAEITGEPPRIVAPLGGDPAFTLLEGATYTGGLVVQPAALARILLDRELQHESAFMGLADFSVTRGVEICPYPDVVFERSAGWTMPAIALLPARLAAFADCSSTDRYYMLAAGYPTRTRPPVWQRRAALTLVKLGLFRLVRVAARVRQRLER